MKKKPTKQATRKALARRMRMRMRDMDVVPNPLKLKAGDRIKFRWYNKDKEEFCTYGYVMKVNSERIMCRFPSHRKAKQIRSWMWLSLTYLDDADRLQRDVVGTIKKIVEG